MSDEILASVTFFHSRPFAPTRRLALGDVHLPARPSPGWGGVLLGGMAASSAGEMAPDVMDEFMVLWNDLRLGRRIVQPRVRHRFQVDRQGLTSATVRLWRGPEGPVFEMPEDCAATPPHFLLAACYSVSAIDAEARVPVLDAIRKGISWQGALDSALVAHLSGTGVGGGLPMDVADPVAWALDLLGLSSADRHDVSAVRRQARRLLREAHPDHGASDETAAERIERLTEARRILLG